MNSGQIISTGALFLLLGTLAPAYAGQEERKEEAKPSKQEEKAKPEKQQEKAKAAKQEEQAKPQKEQQAKPEKQQQQARGQQEQKQQQAKSEKQEQQQQAKGRQEQKQQQAKGQQEAKGRQQASAGHAPQRSQQAQERQRAEPALRLSSRGNGRIPDDRFRANFGSAHRFRIGSPRFVGGYSRFQYGGFWFGFVEPWPEGWYYTDEVYVDYVDGGYFLFNPYYPGVRIGICVVQ